MVLSTLECLMEKEYLERPYHPSFGWFILLYILLIKNQLYLKQNVTGKEVNIFRVSLSCNLIIIYQHY